MDRGFDFRRMAATLLAFGAVACSSSPLAAPRPVTIRVTNSTCEAGPCAPLRILAFPSIQPTTPAGLWSLDLGVIDTPSACLTLASSASFRVSEAGTGNGTTYTWTSADGVSLAAIPVSASRLQASPSTPGFVPLSAPGWSVDLPGSQPPSPSTECAP